MRFYKMFYFVMHVRGPYAGNEVFPAQRRSVAFQGSKYFFFLQGLLFFKNSPPSIILRELFRVSQGLFSKHSMSFQCKLGQLTGVIFMFSMEKQPTFINFFGLFDILLLLLINLHDNDITTESMGEMKHRHFYSTY